MPSLSRPPRKRTSALAMAVAVALLAAACSDNSNAKPVQDATQNQSTDVDQTDQPNSVASETATLQARIAVTYDGGIRVLDANTLEPVADLPTSGFTRLNALGDERNLVVSGPGGFSLLDMGTWQQTHGDHSHYYSQSPTISATFLSAQEPGHVISNGDFVSLFDDATGTSTTYDVADFDSEHPHSTHTAPSAHHGFALPRPDGTLVTTLGTSESRNTVLIQDEQGRELSKTDNCPGVHGESVAQDGIVTVGCEDGVLVIQEDKITKVDSPTPYGRAGTLVASVESPVVLGDYKSDKNAEHESQNIVTLIDTSKNAMSLLELPANYTFRSLARDDDGTALVLTTDGAIQVIDQDSAKLTKSIPVTPTWEVPTEWQTPRPALFSLDGSVYVTSPQENKIYAVDIQSGKIWNEATLDITPNEIAGVQGGTSHSHDAEESAHETSSHSDEHGEVEGHDEEHAHGEEDGHDTHND